KVSAAGARVQTPFTLSDTWTSPGALYWENHPTSRSPWATGAVSVTVVAEIGAVENAVPWTKAGAVDCCAAAGPTRAAPRNRARAGYRIALDGSIESTARHCPPSRGVPHVFALTPDTVLQFNS